MKKIITSLLKHPLNTGLNILGFAMALSLALIVAMYSYHELSANQSHKDIDRIQKVSGWGTPYVMTPFLRERFPEFEAITAVIGYPSMSMPVDTVEVLEYREDMIRSTNGMMQADVDFFKVFTIPMIQGDIKTFFDNPTNTIISESLAKKLFGNQDPIGKSIYMPWGMVKSGTIAGVCKDFADNDSFRFDILTPINTAQPTREGTVATTWQSYNYESFAKVRKDVDLGNLQERMQKCIKEEGNLQYDVAYVCFYPFKDLFFRDDLATNFSKGDIKQVRAMIWVGVLVLVLAIINFFNLSTASATLRTKEIGIRKVNGASRKSLIFQFISESTIITLIGFVLAFGIVNLTIPWFNRFIGIQFDYLYLQTVEQWIFAIVSIVIVGTVAGSYPAFYLSGFRPMDVLFTQRNRSKGTSVVFIRKGLTILQLALTIGVVICTLVIGSQLNYMMTKKLGFDKEQILHHYPANEYQAYISELNALPFIESVSMTSGLVGNTDRGITLKAQCRGAESEIICKTISTDTAFIKTFGLELISGRMFRTDEPKAIIINQEAARQCPEGDALQTIFKVDQNEYKVVGVVKDFHFKSLHNPIEPLMIYMFDVDRDWPIINIRVNKTAMDSLMRVRNQIIKTQVALDAQNPMIPELLDKSLEYNYESEKKFKTSFDIFSGLAVFISCFGLFGLTVFTNNRRVKEIAVRRVNGSTVQQIIGRLIKDYLPLYAISLVVAFPAAYFVCTNYLKDFPYKVAFSVLPYLYAAAIVAAIVFATVSLHSWWAARRNPTNTLKSE